MEKEITVSDAKKKFSKLLRAVEKGDSFVVTLHGQPVAKIVPINEEVARARRRGALLKYLRAKPVTDIGPWTRDELYEDP